MGDGRSAERGDVTDDLHAELLQQLPGDGADGDTRRGLAGAGAFEDVADVVVAVLDRAGQVRVTGTGAGDLRALDARRVRRNLGFHGHGAAPVVPVFVRNEQGNGTAGGFTAADAAQRLRAIRFDD